jgi:hypothetical protein
MIMKRERKDQKEKKTIYIKFFFDSKTSNVAAK